MSWKQTLQAVVAALFGVQSEHHRQRQFRGAPWPYLVAGATIIALFVLALLAIVHWVLSTQ